MREVEVVAKQIESLARRLQSARNIRYHDGSDSFLGAVNPFCRAFRGANLLPVSDEALGQSIVGTREGAVTFNLRIREDEEAEGGFARGSIAGW